MHQPALGQVVVLDRAVLHRAIIPHQQVPSPPLVAIDEGRLDDMVGKRGDQRFGFRASIPSIPVQSSRVT